MRGKITNTVLAPNKAGEMVEKEIKAQVKDRNTAAKELLNRYNITADKDKNIDKQKDTINQLVEFVNGLKK